MTKRIIISILICLTVLGGIFLGLWMKYRTPVHKALHSFTFPECMLEVSGNGTQTLVKGKDLDTKRPVYVVIVPPEECSLCVINNLDTKYGNLYYLAQKTGLFDVMCILSPQNENIEDILELLSFRAFPWPVYFILDTDGLRIHRRVNHCTAFLVKQETIIFDGLPFRDGKILPAFIDLFNANEQN